MKNTFIKNDVLKLVSEIEKYIPKFFDNFMGWEYANGKDAGKDFKRILKLSKKIKAKIKNIDCDASL